MKEVERLKGSIVPLVTPFDESGKLDELAFQELVRWHIRMGSHGISVAGSTGEPNSLSLEERCRLFSLAVEETSSRVPVVAGTGTANLEETLQLTKEAEKRGCDAALVVVPYYSRPNQAGLHDYFLKVAGSTTLPIIVYNIPGRTGTSIEPQTLSRLRGVCRNLVGVKEANRDFEQMSQDIMKCGRGFLVYSGIEALCYPLLAIGGAGFFSATANILPKELAELYNLSSRGEWEKARKLHYKLLPINEALFWDTNPIPVKTALGMMGKINPGLRLPLGAMSKERSGELRKVLKGYGLMGGGFS